MKLNYKEKQKKLDKKYKRRLRFNTLVNINTLGDIIHTLFYSHNRTNTYFVDKNGTLVKQYTGSMKTREDCYIIAKDYLPNITCEQVYKAVESFYKYTYPYLLTHSYCSTVQKRVHSSQFQSKAWVNEQLDKKGLNYKS